MKNIFPFLAFLFFASCVSDDLSKIELQNTLEADFYTTDVVSIGNKAILESQTFSYNLPERLDETGVSTDDIQSVVAESITASLTEPADSTFSMFVLLDVYLKNGVDSVQIATLSDDNDQDVSSLSLRRLTDNGRNFLLNTSSLTSVSVEYQLNTGAVDTIAFSISADLLAEGEVK